MVDHQVLNLKMDRNFLSLNLPRELSNRSEGESLWNPRNPARGETELTRSIMESGASDWDGLQMDENGVKVTFWGTSDRTGKPLTDNLLSDKTKYSVKLSDRISFVLGVSFGGAIIKLNTENTEQNVVIRLN